MSVDDDPAARHARRVAFKVDELRVARDARARLAAEQQGPPKPFDCGTLAEILNRPPEPPGRIPGLIPWEASVLLTAQRKAGKTTLLLNLARCLLTGEPFLGRFELQPVTATVAILNFEVSGAQLARWAFEVGVPHARLFLVNLRGRPNPLARQEDRDRLALLLREQCVETLIIDPFGRAFSGEDQNSASSVGAFLVDLDRFARAEVGARDLVLSAHAGWNAERTRGSSALEDWADAVLTLTRDQDDEHGPRYLRATGRDVELEEDRLEFNRDTRCLTLSGGGSRRQAAATRKVDTLLPVVLDILAEEPGLGVNNIRQKARAANSGVSFRDGDINRVLQAAIECGDVRTEGGGPGRKLLHYRTDANQCQTDARPHPATDATEAYMGASVPVPRFARPSPADLGTGSQTPDPPLLKNVTATRDTTWGRSDRCRCGARLTYDWKRRGMCRDCAAAERPTQTTPTHSAG
jgi:hypothetical protein